MDSALGVLTEKGLTGFSLREAARRAGVSQSAPKHHFTDTKGLLTALAARAFEALADRLEAADASEGDRRAQISAQGLAYVDFALTEPALFDLMWRASLLDLTDGDLLGQKQRAFAILDRRIRGPHATIGEHIDPSMAPSYACWSLVHGFARLALDGAFGNHTNARIPIAADVLQNMLDLLHLPDGEG